MNTTILKSAIPNRIRNWYQLHPKKTIGVIVAILLVVVIIFVRSGDQYIEHIVANEQLNATITLYGRVEAKQQSDLQFPVSGILSSVAVIPGDKVSSGQVLARLRAGDVSAQYSVQQANVQKAKIQKGIGQVNLLSAEKDKEIAIAAAKQAVVNARSDMYSDGLEAVPENSAAESVEPPVISGVYTSEITGTYILQVYSSQSDSGYSVRISGLESGSAPVQYQNPSALGTRGLFIRFVAGEGYGGTTWKISVPNTSSPSYITNKNAYDTAVATYNQTIREKEAGVSVAELENASNESIASVNLSSASAELQKTAAQLEDRILRAPFSGVVGYTFTNVGEFIDSNQVVATVYNPEAYFVRIKVPEKLVLRLVDNTPANVQLDALPETSIPAHVVTVYTTDSVIENSHVYEALVQLDPGADIKKSIRPGLGGSVTITFGESKTGIAVPDQAITKKGEQSFVQKKIQDEYQETIVVVGDSFNGMTEIISGLSEGDIVGILPLKESK